MFQLFFTNAPGESGMGLAGTNFRIVQLHNGSIDFTDEISKERRSNRTAARGMMRIALQCHCI